MKVIEQFYDVKTGEAGRREVEIPDVITAEEAAQRQPALEREQRREDLKLQMHAVLVDQALGVDVSDRLSELREAYQKL